VGWIECHTFGNDQQHLLSRAGTRRYSDKCEGGVPQQPAVSFRVGRHLPNELRTVVLGQHLSGAARHLGRNRNKGLRHRCRKNQREDK